MERQQYLNIMILHHLPKVVNVMQMFNMMMLGLVVSQPVFFSYGRFRSSEKFKDITKKTNHKNWRKVNFSS